MNSKNTTVIKYQLKIENTPKYSYEIEIDNTTLQSKHTNFNDMPEWTDLEFEQCPNCPLQKKDFPKCPLAASLSGAVDHFENTKSYTLVDVYVKVSERIYFKKCSIQDALSALFGLIMATSACPHFDFIRPLAKHHLPFASIEETMIRVLGNIFIHQYFQSRKNQTTFVAEEAIENLFLHYRELEKINKAMLKRIHHCSRSDADKNAFVSLNTLAQLFELEYESNLETLAKIYDRDLVAKR